MNYSSYIIGLIIPFLSFIFQTYPRFFNKYYGVDVWTRLIEADLIRKNNHKVPMKKISNGFILDGYFDYPPALAWLLSYIPKKKLLNIQGFIAPIFDVIQNYLVFLICLQITPSLEIALLAQAIYGAIPLTILENSYLTPRSLGYLNFTLALFPLLVYSVIPRIEYLIVGFVFLVILFFTHKFAVQSFFFISIFMTIFERNPFYILIFFTGMITAIIISKGYYLRILRGHIVNIIYWTKIYNYRFAHQIRGLGKVEKKDFVNQIYSILFMFSPATLIGVNLWIIIPLGISLAYFYGFKLAYLSDPLMIKLIIWVDFFYIIGVLILAIKQLIPIGDGQRYIEMVIVPTALISSITFFSLLQTPYKTLTIVCYSLIFIINIILTIIMQIKAIVYNKDRSLTKDMKKVFTYINKLKPKSRIICIPPRITTMILYHTSASVLVEIQAGGLIKANDVFPVIRRSIPEIAKKYNLNLLVLKKDYVNMEELNLSKKSLLLETDTTQVFRI